MAPGTVWIRCKAILGWETALESLGADAVCFGMIITACVLLFCSFMGVQLCDIYLVLDLSVPRRECTAIAADYHNMIESIPIHICMNSIRILQFRICMGHSIRYGWWINSATPWSDFGFGCAFRNCVLPEGLANKVTEIIKKTKK